MELKRNYLFPDPRLQQLCDEKLSIAGRDAYKINSEGITPSRLMTLSARNTAFKELPSEYELNVRIEEATASKCAIAAQVRTALRIIVLRIENKPGSIPELLKLSGNRCLEKMDDHELLTYGMDIVQLATEILPELLESGLTPAMPTTLYMLCHEFDLAIDKLRKEVTDLNIITEERIAEGNMIYEELQILCSKGKHAWAGINDDKYKDYIIYNTPTTRPERTGFSVSG